MNKSKETATVEAHPARALRAELAHKIASFLGNEEKRTTEIPGMSLHRRTSPTPPCRTTYHPGIIVVAQGAKQVNLGQKSFIYDESNYLLTAVDLPIVSWVAKATEENPCLVLSLKLDIAMVRELLSREEIHIADAPSDSPAMSIGQTTPEFLSACCRLLDLLKSPQDIPFLSGLIQRESHLFRGGGRNGQSVESFLETRDLSENETDRRCLRLAIHKATQVKTVPMRAKRSPELV